MIAAILVACCFALVIVGLPGGSRLRPAVLHNVAWMLGLSIVASGVMGYGSISGHAWALIAGSLVLVNAGCAVASGSDSQLPRDRSSTTGPTSASAIKMWHFLVLVMLFTFGVVQYLLTVSSLFGLDVLLSDPARILSATDVNYLVEFPVYGKVPFYLGPLCLVLCIFPQYVRGLAGKRWRLPLLLAIGAAQLATLQRTNLFVALVWVMGLLVIGAQPRWREARSQDVLDTTTARRPGRTILAAVVIGVVGLAAFQGLATALGKTGQRVYDFNAPVNPSLRYSPWVSPTFYASSGIPAFSRLVESPDTGYPPQGSGVVGTYNPHTWGIATISGLTRVLPGVRRWNEVGTFTRVPQLTNVYTWLEPWYRDFRDFGVILGSLGIGMLMGGFARRANRSISSQLAAGFIIGNSLLAGFVNRYGMVMSMTLYLALIALGRANPGDHPAQELDHSEVTPLRDRAVSDPQPG